jgi:predicted transposase/invertase (TIGR01784 family)
MRAHYKNPLVHRAFDILETLSADQKVRRLAEMRETALRNEISALADARREGEEEGIKKGEKKGKKEGREEQARSTAETLLRMGVLSPEQIAEATGLSRKDILKIQKKMS